MLMLFLIYKMMATPVSLHDGPVNADLSGGRPGRTG